MKGACKEVQGGKLFLLRPIRRPSGPSTSQAPSTNRTKCAVRFGSCTVLRSFREEPFSSRPGPHEYTVSCSVKEEPFSSRPGPHEYEEGGQVCVLSLLDCNLKTSQTKFCGVRSICRVLNTLSEKMSCHTRVPWYMVMTSLWYQETWGDRMRN